jgi:hypothetical protein
MSRWRADHAPAREAWSRMVSPYHRGNAMVGDILCPVCLPDGLLWRCLTWYWMGARNHLAPCLGPCQCAVVTMASSLDHVRSRAGQRACTRLGSTRRAFDRDGATRLRERGTARKRCQQSRSHGVVVGGRFVLTKPECRRIERRFCWIPRPSRWMPHVFQACTTHQGVAWKPSGSSAGTPSDALCTSTLLCYAPPGHLHQIILQT